MGLVGALSTGQIGSERQLTLLHCFIIFSAILSHLMDDFFFFTENMHNYQRKTEQAKTLKNVIRNAVDAALINGGCIRQTAKDFNIPLGSLTQYCQIMKRSSNE